MSTPRAERTRLPHGWREGLTEDRVQLVLSVERYSKRGLYILSRPDESGYLWVRLCVGHPYANKHGWQRLHRYLMMRALGRRLHWYEHVHHQNGDKLTTNIRDLSLMEAVDHGHMHYAARLSRRGQKIPLWFPRDARGRFTKLPTVETTNSSDEVPF